MIHYRSKNAHLQMFIPLISIILVIVSLVGCDKFYKYRADFPPQYMANKGLYKYRFTIDSVGVGLQVGAWFDNPMVSLALTNGYNESMEFVSESHAIYCDGNSYPISSFFINGKKKDTTCLCVIDSQDTMNLEFHFGMGQFESCNDGSLFLVLGTVTAGSSLQSVNLSSYAFSKVYE